jgi:hypothetical protein
MGRVLHAARRPEDPAGKQDLGQRGESVHVSVSQHAYHTVKFGKAVVVHCRVISIA